MPNDTSMQLSDGDFAKRLEIPDIAGKLREGIRVQYGTRALLFEDGRYLDQLPAGLHTFPTRSDGAPEGAGVLARILPGAGQSTERTILVIDAGDVDVSLSAEGLLTREEVAVDLRCTLALHLESPEAFYVNLMKAQGALGVDDLGHLLTDEAALALQEAVSTLSASDLYGNLATRDHIESALVGAMRPSLSRYGLEIRQLPTVAFVSPELEQLAHKRGEIHLYRQWVQIGQDYREAELAADEGRLGIEERAIDLMRKWVDLYHRAQQILTDDRTRSALLEEDYDALLDELDVEKILRTEEKEEFRRLLRERSQDHSLAREHFLRKLEIENDIELLRLELERQDLQHKRSMADLEHKLTQRRLKLEAELEDEQERPNNEPEETRPERPPDGERPPPAKPPSTREPPAMTPSPDPSQDCPNCGASEQDGAFCPECGCGIQVLFNVRHVYQVNQRDALTFLIRNQTETGFFASLSVELENVSFTDGTQEQRKEFRLPPQQSSKVNLGIYTGEMGGRAFVNKFRIVLRESRGGDPVKAFELVDNGILFEITNPGEEAQRAVIAGGVHIEIGKILGSEVGNIVGDLGARPGAPQGQSGEEWQALPLCPVELPETTKPSDPVPAGKRAYQVVTVVRHHLHMRTVQDGQVTGTEAVEIPRDLGALRSVCSATCEGRTVLLVGAQRGVCVVNDRGEIERFYRLPDSSTPSKYAVSRAAMSQGNLYARHQAYGVWRWSLDAEGTGECVSAEARTLDTDANGNVWVAVKDQIRCVIENGPALSAGTGDGIRCLAIGLKGVYVWDRKGRIMSWPNPVASNVSLVDVTKQPGHSLAAATIEGVEYVIYPEEQQVICRPSAGHAARREFKGVGGTLSVATACGNYIAALDWGRDPRGPSPTTAYLWDWDHPGLPFMTWDVRAETGHTLQDIAVVRR